NELGTEGSHRETAGSMKEKSTRREGTRPSFTAAVISSATRPKNASASFALWTWPAAAAVEERPVEPARADFTPDVQPAPGLDHVPRFVRGLEQAPARGRPG